MRGVWADFEAIFLFSVKKYRKKLDFVDIFGILCAPQHLAAPEKENAPVAQLDRASDYGSEGLGFESLRACFLQQLFQKNAGFVLTTGFF